MVKRIVLLTIALTIAYVIPSYAGILDYSEETKKLMKEAGLYSDNDWEKISRNQGVRKQRLSKKSTSNNDELHVKSSDKVNSESVAVTDTADDLHVYSNEYSNQTNNYGSKNSYDEFHTALKDISSNDGYKSGGFDELHINENYKQNVWHPANRGYRIEGFDEFRYPDEM